MSQFRHLLCAALLLAAASARAQTPYVWIDDKGLRQYSDRPPPPTVPLNKILKSPRPMGQTTAPDVQGNPAVEVAAPGVLSPAKAPPTLADREADFRKRQKEQQEAQQKQDQEAAMKKQACDAALRNRGTLQAGGRIKEYDAKGEAQYLSDEERARRLAEANRAIAEHGCR